MKTSTTWAIACAAALLIAAGCNLDNNQHEWAESSNLQDLRDAEEGSARRQAAAQALCREAHGEAEALWTPDGDLVCRPRRGIKTAKVQL